MGLCRALLVAPTDRIVEAYTAMEPAYPNLRRGVEELFAGGALERLRLAGGGAVAPADDADMGDHLPAAAAAAPVIGPGVPQSVPSGVLHVPLLHHWGDIGDNLPAWVAAFPLTYARGPGRRRPGLSSMNWPLPDLRGLAGVPPEAKPGSPLRLDDFFASVYELHSSKGEVSLPGTYWTIR